MTPKAQFSYFTDLTICGNYLERRDFEFSRLAGGVSVAHAKRLHDLELQIFRDEICQFERAFDFSSNAVFTRWDNIARARRQIFLLVNGNSGDFNLFVSFTFNKEHYDGMPATAWRQFRSFVNRYSCFLFGRKNKIKIVAVCERGEKNERLHFHAVIMDVPEFLFRSDLALAKACLNEETTFGKCWKFGFVDVRDASRVKDGKTAVENIGAYIAKYLIPDARPKGAVSYYSSRNLRRPQKFYREENVLDVLNSMEYDIIATEYKNYNNGSVQKIICKKKY